MQSDDVMTSPDFEAMPPKMKVKMLDMLAASGMESREWWEKILCGFEVPDAPLGE